MISQLTRLSQCVSLTALSVSATVLPAQNIAPAPAFSADELTALPSTHWITNGGNNFNQRYSPLTQINRFNVNQLKALWKTEMGSGDQLKNGGQTQILHHEGTLFVSNGQNHVFAIDAVTGEIFCKPGHRMNNFPEDVLMLAMPVN